MTVQIQTCQEITFLQSTKSMSSSSIVSLAAMCNIFSLSFSVGLWRWNTLSILPGRCNASSICLRFLVVAIKTTPSCFSNLQKAFTGRWENGTVQRVGLELLSPMRLNCDNKYKYDPKDAMFQDRTKHEHIDRHLIQEKLKEGQLENQYIPTDSQTAEIFSKALPRQQFELLSS